jgi:hypothetical protein
MTRNMSFPYNKTFKSWKYGQEGEEETSRKFFFSSLLEIKNEGTES